ncbi:MAG: hypothetical protein DMD70_13335 [Gemmatimonadetes bacterium]|nr:MAG: hypothetical protein DMD70_13335 [Gemmatimonadota bacterium]
MVPEAPHVERGVRVRAAGGAQARVEAKRDLPRDDVHHTAQGGRAVERRSGALHDLHAGHVGERHHVPIDPTPIALVGGNAVYEQEYARAEALHEAARAADVHLAVEKQNPGGPVHGFVDRFHRAMGEVGIAHERHARRGLVEELGALGRRDDRGLQLDGDPGQPIVALDRVSR